MRNLQQGRHSVAEKIFHGRKGRLYRRYYEGMEDQLGALGLVQLGRLDGLLTAMRERKRRIEAAEAFRSGGRPEQAAAEEAELAVLQEFMPEPMGEEELEEIVDSVIAEVGATAMRHFGRVMADVMPQVSGRADGSVVSQLVREKLA